ncbi:conserved hypothetical protein [Andreprevotia lacus DSM 23236]|jgi:uncharacterized protein (TIGR02285 family)|uniref:Solute-binding protein family 3/N-terminal domain-containing protein n=1 Tax=Andreprevotia lacus DSM 23236 TaxID=1121001 RepID=A0A1W1X161_9NEIS|nr:TIGR02285 family protein [Andreprevotia lacus]SMC17645.1 conserved hypothetical protein [Andreprevotia lacus DSM 23236]
MKPLLLGMMLTVSQGCASVTHAQELPQINWVLLDWQPVFLLHEGQTPGSPQELGSGMADKALKLLAARLPQYRHQYRRGDSQRAFGEMARGQPVCFFPSFQTEERRKFAYQLPAMMTVPHQLVIDQAQQARFRTDADGVSLAGLRKQAVLRGYVEKGRSYTSALDVLIDAPGSAIRRIAQPEKSHLLRLLDSGQIDYTIEYPYVVSFQTQNGVFNHTLVTLPINELTTPLVWHISCTRNEWGKVVSRDLAQALRDLAGEADWRQISEQGLSAATTQRYHARFKAFYDALKLNGNTPP